MIRDYLNFRKLKRGMKEFEQDHRLTLDEIKYFEMFDVDRVDKRQRENTALAYWEQKNELRVLETKALRRSAEKYGVQLKKDWLEMAFSRTGEQLHLFSDEAMVKAEQAIRAKKKENRENIERWVTKVVVPVLGALTGLIGVLLAIYALRK